MPKGICIRDDEKELARALLAMGRSYREVAEAMELSVGSIHNIAKEPIARIEPVVREIRRRFAMKHWLLSDHILSGIRPRDLLHATLREKALASAILTDKALALEKALKDAAQEPPAMPEVTMPEVTMPGDTLADDTGDERRMNTLIVQKPPVTLPIPPRD